MEMTNKQWWHANVRPFLPDAEIEWEQLSWWERHWSIPRLRKSVRN